MIPEENRYTKDHEWISIDGDVATIGITDYATEELGEIVYVELPDIGDTFSESDEFGTVESVKTVSSLYAPVSGEVVDVNESLNDSPEVINEDAYKRGWIIKIKVENTAEMDALLDAAAYQALLDE